MARPELTLVLGLGESGLAMARWLARQGVALRVADSRDTPPGVDRLRAEGVDDVPVIVGGIIPESDAVRLKELGVAEVFTPKDFGLNDIMGRFVDVIRASRNLE